MEIASTINHRNFHTVANDTFARALKGAGLDTENFHVASESQDGLLSVWKDDIKYDRARKHGSFLVRVMQVFPQLTKQLDRFITANKTNNIQIFNKSCNLVERSLSLVLRQSLMQFVEDTERERQSLGQKYSLLKEDVQEALDNVVDAYGMLVGGITNAFKTYFGFAKLAARKLKETSGSVDAVQIKKLIFRNRELLQRLASMAMPLLMLFDNMNGVNIDSEISYKYSAKNFEIVDGALAPTQDFLRRFIAKISCPKQTVIREAGPGNEVNSYILLDYMKDPDHAVQTHGCIAFKEGLMDRFFDQMDAMMGKLVDMHFA